jgi:4-amino-4-deoxy-L-arabinose transferase-like glycosyltransferase
MSGLAVQTRTIVFALLVAAVVPYFVGLGSSSIWDANEAFYAQTPREMMSGHDFVNPSFNFQLRYNKPVFSYWEVAAFYRAFGVSEWSERLPIALGGAALIGIAFGLARVAGGTEAGLIAALVLATSPRFFLLARRIVIDIDVAMFTGLVLLCFALSEVRSARRLYLLLMYLAAGFGVLTKGPVAVFLPGLVFLLYLASQKRLAEIGRMMLPVGAVVGLAVVLPWYVMVYRQHGAEYIWSFVFGENLGRYAETVGEQARGPFFYVPVALADLFPWSVLTPISLWLAVRRRDNRTIRLLLLWIAVIVVFFSFSATKEDLYVLPIVPAEAALIGVFLARSSDVIRNEDQFARWWLAATSIALLLAGAVALWVFAVTHRYTLQGGAFIGAALLTAGLAALVASVRRGPLTATFAVAAGLAVASWAMALVVLPDFERYKPVRPFADIIRSRASVGAIVGYYKFALPSMVYYLNRPIMEVILPDHLRAVFYSGSDIYFVMPETEYEHLKDRLPSPTYVLSRRPMFDLRPTNFLHGTELPQFVLISNRPAEGVQ